MQTNTKVDIHNVLEFDHRPQVIDTKIDPNIKIFKVKRNLSTYKLPHTKEACFSTSSSIKAPSCFKLDRTPSKMTPFLYAARLILRFFIFLLETKKLQEANEREQKNETTKEGTRIRLTDFIFIYILSKHESSSLRQLPQP